MRDADRDGAAAVDAAAPILEYRGVTKTFHSARSDNEVHALAAVDLAIDRGEFITFVGPSGCGKSTLLNITAALTPPSSGEVRLMGSPHAEPSRRIGVMFQSPVLLPWRTVEQNALLPAEVYGQKGSAIRDKVGEVLSLVGLADFAKAYPEQLSGGMQQRASLARVLAYEPDVLLMDEPFGALDEFTREAMNLELSRLTQPRSITVLFVTHNIPEAVFLADRVVVMSARPGRIAGVIPVPFDQPRTIDVMREQEFTDLVFTVRSALAA